MGCAPYQTLDYTWVNNDKTYQQLFNKLANPTVDPEVLIVSGIISSAGFEKPIEWSTVEHGILSDVVPGDYAVRFEDINGMPIGEDISFAAEPIASINKGVAVGQDTPNTGNMGTVQTDEAAFIFAVQYPSETAQVQILDKSTPDQPPKVITTVPAEQIQVAAPSFNGFLQPINDDGSSVFKLKSTVPVKFQLLDANGNYINTAVASITVAKLSGAIYGDDSEALSTSAASTGNLFRYDLSTNQYVFNLATKSLSAGTWRITVTLDTGAIYQVQIGQR
jgi:hypothetical protein